MRPRLEQRRLIAGLGSIEDLQVRLQLEALRQGITTAPQVVWISDGARGFWRLFQQHFSGIAIGILDFYIDSSRNKDFHWFRHGGECLQVAD